MNLINTTRTLTMSSLDIAELCEVRHDNVMRDIRYMMEELHGEGVALKFEGYYIAENGKRNPCYHLPKRETLILISGYRLDIRARIIDRWQELENQARTQSHGLPDLRQEMQRLADQQEKILQALTGTSERKNVQAIDFPKRNRSHPSDPLDRIRANIKRAGTIGRSELLSNNKSINSHALDAIIEALSMSGEVRVERLHSGPAGGCPKTLYHYVREAE